MKENEIMEQVHSRLGISELNPMQRLVADASRTHRKLIVYSPTGSGKTLAFSLPLLRSISGTVAGIQALVVSSSRELVAQTAQVLRTVAVGLKVTECYGGHPVQDECQSLSVAPAVVVATPGRLLDHIGRGNIDVSTVKCLVLDEFDKSLELGFEDEMCRLLGHLRHVTLRILTSATRMASVPAYALMDDALTLNCLDEMPLPASRTTVWQMVCHTVDKQADLLRLLLWLPHGKILVFVNYREQVEPLCRFLNEHHVQADAYHGALDQVRREIAMAKFKNGSTPVLVTTDLAARGIDVEDVYCVVHYQLPCTADAYVHRNGRTARVDRAGQVCVLTAPDESIPAFVVIDSVLDVPDIVTGSAIRSSMSTLYINAGKKEKISRGDVVGYIVANSEMPPQSIGKIDVFDHHALVAVPCEMAATLVTRLSPHKIKGRRVMVSIA